MVVGEISLLEREPEDWIIFQNIVCVIDIKSIHAWSLVLFLNILVS